MRKVNRIVVDIDGCVVSTSSDRDGITEEYYEGLYLLQQQIKKANEGAFPKISFCTGRDRNYVEAVSFFLGIPAGWSIIESGIALFNPYTKEIILNPALTPETREIFEKISKKIIPEIIEKNPEFFLYPGNMINVAIEKKHNSQLPIEECFRMVKEELENRGLLSQVEIRYSSVAVDISPKGIDKKSGLEFFCKREEINPENILGIGDSNGDFPILSSVGFAGCPANATPECKKLIRERESFISPFPYARGTGDIITHFRPYFS